MMIGTNKVLFEEHVRVPHFRGLLLWLLADVQKQGATKVLFCTLPPLFGDPWEEAVTMCNAVIADVMRTRKGMSVGLVDVSAAFLTSPNLGNLLFHNEVDSNSAGLRLIWN